MTNSFKSGFDKFDWLIVNLLPWIRRLSERGAHVIIWCLKFEGPKCAYLGSEIYGRQDSLGLIFLCAQKLISQSKNFRWTGDYLGL